MDRPKDSVVLSHRFFQSLSGSKTNAIQILYLWSFKPKFVLNVELVSKELNHLAAILHVYAGGLNFMK